MSLSRCCAVLLLASGLIVASSAGLDAKDPAGKQASKNRKPPPKPEARQTAGDDAAQRALVVGAPLQPTVVKIHAALRDPTVIEFVETPLQDVVDYLKDYHKIEIQLDKPALDNAGIGTDTPITRNLRGMSLQSAFDLLLAQHNLTWIIDHEVLLITTAAAADTRREVCVYNLGAIVGEGSTEELSQVVWKSLVPVGQRDESADLSVIPYRHLLIVRHSQQGHRQVTQLLEQLKTALAPAK